MASIVMPHLPNEIWLRILDLVIEDSHPCELWEWRTCNRQLRDLIEDTFYTTCVQKLKLVLPVGLPTYDVRNPLRGNLTFAHVKGDSHRAQECRRTIFCLESVSPEIYDQQLRRRWEAMCSKYSSQTPDAGIVWLLHYQEHDPVKVRLPSLRLEGRDSSRLDQDSLSFEWRPMAGVYTQRWLNL